MSRYTPSRMLPVTHLRAPIAAPGGQNFFRSSAGMEGIVTVALIAAIVPTRVTTPASVACVSPKSTVAPAIWI